MRHLVRALAVLALGALLCPGALLAQRPSARQLVLQALHAVEGDSAPQLAARLRTQLAGNPGDRGALLGVAEIARLTYRPEAESLFRRVCGPGAPADDYSAYARLGLGALLYDGGKPQQAVAAYDSARAAALRAGDAAAQALAVMRGGYAAATTAGPAVGLAALAVAERLLPPEAVDLRTELLYRRALLLGVEAKPEARVVAWSSIALARRVGDDPALEAGGYNSLGIHYQVAQQYDSAVLMFRRAAELYGLAHNRFFRGVALLRAGDMLREYAELGEARALMLEGQADGEASHNPLVVSSTGIGLGAIALQLGDYPTAVAELTRVRAQFEARADTPSLRLVDYFEGLSRAGAGELTTGRTLLTRSGEYYRTYGDFDNYLQCLRALLDILTRQRDWPAAEGVLAQARALALAKQHPEWLRGLQYDQGHLALARGDLPAAERFLTSFLATVDTAEHLRRHNTGVQLAEVYARRGDLDRAEAAVTRAGAELDRWRASIGDRALRVYAFQANSQDVDDRGASLARVLNLLAVGGRAGPAFEQAERNRARELGDALARAAALRTGAGAGGRPAGAAKTAPAAGAGAPTVRRLMAALPAGTALLEYVAGQAGAPTTVFVVTRNSVAARTLRPLDELTPDIARFAALLEDGAEPRALSRSLAGSVLAPALALLPSGIVRLIVVPDGELHRLPFDALRLADGHYVLERYAVSTVPSAGVLLELWQTRSATRDARPPTRLLAFGDPAFPPAGDGGARGLAAPPRAPDGDDYRGAFSATGGLPRLPESGREARLVAQYAPAAVVRLRQAASAAFLKHSPLESFRVIHFATHAIVDERSAARTALALAPGGGENGFVGPGDLAALRLRADLVVLSACRTAGGLLIGGEGVEGLTAPLLQAGTRTVVATSWRVSDRRTVDLVRSFYDALAHGQTTGDALRAAKLAALRRGQPPRDWAAFGVVGDPFVVVPLRTPPSTWPWLLLTAVTLALSVVLARRYRPRSRSTRMAERVSAPSPVLATTHQR